MEELICSLYAHKSPYESERETGISLSSVRRIVKNDFAPAADEQELKLYFY